MDTFNLLKRGTWNPFSFKRLARVLRSERGEVATFTQEEVDAKISEAVGKAGNGFDGFAQEVKEHPDIKRYKSTEELAKGHIELGRKIGLKGVMVPSEGSSDQVKSDFYKAVGRPDTSDGYSNPVLDGLHDGVKTTTEQDLKAFKDMAYQEGLSSKQFTNIYDWYLKMNSQRLTDWDGLQKEEKDKSATALREKWGAKYDGNLALAGGLIKNFGSDNMKARIGEIGSDPDVIELLATLGSHLSEDKLGDLGRSGVIMTPEQAKLEISKITQTIMGTDQGDPIYSELLKKKDSLYKMAYPG